MEHETEFIPELSAVSVPATPAVPDTRSDVALRRELAFHKNESAKKDDIMRRHGIPTQPVVWVQVMLYTNHAASWCWSRYSWGVR